MARSRHCQSIAVKVQGGPGDELQNGAEFHSRSNIRSASGVVSCVLVSADLECFNGKYAYSVLLQKRITTIEQYVTILFISAYSVLRRCSLYTS